ncbi:MAG TPA: twin-arginine translocase TatA/TatE family subunit [Polyangiaceae bacterium]|jgi:sec-independent protein translocase protein TatA|nr:twin-arginine translocase TatA/TatE family subunit [Polyangiaceae bacterium]
MGNIGPGELLIIGLIALLLFGAGRIADIGKGLGQGISNFKKGLREADDEDKPKKIEKSEKAEKSEKVAKDDDDEKEAKAEEKPAKA